MGAGLPGTFTAHVSPARNEGRPSTGTLIPGNIKSAPPMMNRETSPPFSMKTGKSSGTFHRANTAMENKLLNPTNMSIIIIKNKKRIKKTLEKNLQTFDKYYSKHVLLQKIMSHDW